MTPVRAEIALQARVDLSRFVARPSGVLFLDGGGLLVGDPDRRRLVRISGGHAEPLLEPLLVTGIVRAANGLPVVSFAGDPAPGMAACRELLFVSKPVCAVDGRGRLYGVLASESEDRKDENVVARPLGARVDPERGETLLYNKQIRAFEPGAQPPHGFLRLTAIATRTDDTVFFLGSGTIAKVDGALNLLVEVSPEGAIRRGYPYATHIRRDSVAAPERFSFARDGTYAGLAVSSESGAAEEVPLVGVALEYKALAALTSGGVVLAEDRELFYVRPGEMTPTPLAVAEVLGVPLVAPWLLVSYGETFSFLNAVTNVVYRAQVVVDSDWQSG